MQYENNNKSQKTTKTRLNIQEIKKENVFLFEKMLFFDYSCDTFMVNKRRGDTK